MKKLMIAAAMAALIGGVEAAQGDLVYNITVSVKTTTGKAGSATKTATKYYGKVGTWWYEDSAFDADQDGKFASLLKADKSKVYTIKQSDVNKLSYDDQADLATVLSAYELAQKPKVVCLALYTTVAGECYRVASSKKFTAYGLVDACCNVDQFNDINVVTDYTDDTTQIGTLDFTQLAYRFGAQGSKANKVEWYADEGATDAESLGVFKEYAAAGQGSFDVNNARISSLSGNIVGILDNPDCPANCCDTDTAWAYLCDGSKDADITTLVGTAAYGSFTIKFNSSLTKKNQ